MQSGRDTKKTFNDSEVHLNSINVNVFFKEFTFGLTNFIKDSSNREIELTDSIVWLDDVTIIYEVKGRNQDEKQKPFINWFKNKILNKSVKQIKNTIKILNSNNPLLLKNNRGHEMQINEISIDNLSKVIIYNPNEEISDEYRFKKFYESKEVQLIHLFHLEDYLWVCKYLITPYEVKDYLTFREEFYLAQGTNLNKLPEQYILAHFFSDSDYYTFVPENIEILSKITKDNDSFNLTRYLSEFGDKVEYTVGATDYYIILKEIAKLHRNELKEFKKRFNKIFQLCQEDEFTDPYRITISTGCGFVFLGLPKKLSEHWKNSITNIALAHKYDQKLNKCIGVVVFEEAPKRFEVFWIYAEDEWMYDEEMEKLITELPLRKLKMKPFQGYNL